jgi:hypothetical protein
VTRWEAQQGSIADLVARIVEERAEAEQEREQLADDVVRTATISARAGRGLQGACSRRRPHRAATPERSVSDHGGSGRVMWGLASAPDWPNDRRRLRRWPAPLASLTAPGSGGPDSGPPLSEP